MLAALAPALAALALAGCAEAERPAAAPGDRRTSLLLVTVDTLRADHLGAWGHPLETSPAIDALAAEGVRFADATVQWPKTWPSTASLLTGTWPTQTGVRYRPRRPLPERNRTLAEILAEAGCRTAGVVANANLGRRFAFDQGFEHFVESWMRAYREQFGERAFRNRPGRVKRFTDARGVVDEGLAWLESLGPGERFFLWLHFMEPHGPYVAPERYEGLFDGHYPSTRVPLAALPGYQVQRDGRGAPVRDLGFYQTRYDREIRHLDGALARLLEALERLGRRRDTLVAPTADHGESLVEDGYYLEHGRLPFQPAAHVPLVLALEGALPEGAVVPEPVGLVDLAPTLLELLDVPVPARLVGRSLVPLARGEREAAPPFVFFGGGDERAPTARGAGGPVEARAHPRAGGPRDLGPRRVVALPPCSGTRRRRAT